MHDHHKTMAAFVGFFTADKTFDIAKEHIFLAAHETLTHWHFLYASLPAAFIVIVVAVIAAYCFNREGTK